jgi:hypothetical protein
MPDFKLAQHWWKEIESQVRKDIPQTTKQN